MLFRSRLSSGVVLGEQTTIGLAGTVMARHDERGRRIPLSVGRHCTIGVSAGTVGVNLGDDCHIDKNILIDKDTPVELVDEGRRVSAWELDGRDRMHFFRHPDFAAVCMRATEV
nr:DapH/DapD/GlmU-related protein [uncultured Corynebacterium sp.]